MPRLELSYVEEQYEIHDMGIEVYSSARFLQLRPSSAPFRIALEPGAPTIACHVLSRNMVMPMAKFAKVGRGKMPIPEDESWQLKERL